MSVPFGRISHTLLPLGRVRVTVFEVGEYNFENYLANFHIFQMNQVRFCRNSDSDGLSLRPSRLLRVLLFNKFEDLLPHS